MIIEVAHVTVTPGSGPAFETAVAEAIKVFKQAKGCQGLHLQKCIEFPDEYEVIIRWDTLENHTIDFREGPLFQDWRGLVGGFFAKPPEVKHYEVAVPRATFT
jgi:heme-degrading monooxygenase HmoA